MNVLYMNEHVVKLQKIYKVPDLIAKYGGKQTNKHFQLKRSSSNLPILSSESYSSVFCQGPYTNTQFSNKTLQQGASPNEVLLAEGAVQQSIVFHMLA